MPDEGVTKEGAVVKIKKGPKRREDLMDVAIQCCSYITASRGSRESHSFVCLLVFFGGGCCFAHPS